MQSTFIRDARYLVCESCFAVVAVETTIHAAWLAHAKVCREGCPAPPESEEAVRKLLLTIDF